MKRSRRCLLSVSRKKGLCSHLGGVFGCLLSNVTSKRQKDIKNIFQIELELLVRLALQTERSRCGLRVYVIKTLQIRLTLQSEQQKDTIPLLRVGGKQQFTPSRHTSKSNNPHHYESSFLEVSEDSRGHGTKFQF
jgi:hypothetical protein